MIVTSELVFRHLIELFVQGLVLMAAALCIDRAARRASAANRCLIWQTAAVLLVILPVVSVLSPGVTLQLPSQFTSVVATPGQSGTPSAIVSVSHRPTTDAAVVNLPRSISSTLRAANTSNPARMSLDGHGRDRANGSVLFNCITGVWGLVTVALLIEFATRRLRLLTLRSAGCAATRSLIIQCAAGVALRLGVTRDVLILQHPGALPMAWGWRSPVILLPSSADSWPSERIEMVMLHEFAHIRRGDWAAQWLMSLMCCIYWFNPLCWLCLREVQRTAEEACDDVVINSGISGADYAAELLEVIKSMKLEVNKRSGGTPAAVSMAQSGQIRARLRSVLAADTNRRSIGSYAVVYVVAATLCLLPLGSVHVFAQSKYGSSENGATRTSHIAAELAKQADTLAKLNAEISASAAGSSMTAVQKRAIEARQQEVRKSLAEVRASLKSLAASQTSSQALLSQQRREIEQLRKQAAEAREMARREVMSAEVQRKTAEVQARDAQVQAESLHLLQNDEHRKQQFADSTAEMQQRQAELKALADLLKVTEGRYRSGIATFAEVEAATANLERAKTDLLARRAEVSVRRSDLDQAASDVRVRSAELKLIEEQLARLKQLNKAGAVPNIDVDSASVDLLRAQGQLQAAQAKMEALRRAAEEFDVQAQKEKEQAEKKAETKPGN